MPSGQPAAACESDFAPALVGFCCRLPKASGADEFWRLLVEGVDAIVETPPERWDADALHAVDRKAPGKMVTRWGGYIDDCDKFDADFFRMSAEESARVDPQQRLLLELTWGALENAGIAPASLSGRKVGVFVGVSHSDYERLIYREIAGITGFEGPGAYHSIIANRVSYFLNLSGPSMVVDTACSSTLTALHVACRMLRHGDCELAIVAGSSLNLTPEETISLSQAGLMSPTGRSRAFAEGADGFVRGEGVGVLVLARDAATARRERLRIRALVRGSAINQDGSSNGLMAPNGNAQRVLLEDALRDANVAASDVDYIETHGTGTEIGDSIEFGAIRAVYAGARERPCLIGSVKTNIGHLEAASGVAGIIKVVLSMENELIPKQLHFERPSRYLELENSGIDIALEARPWPARETPRRAGVSAFGFGGANAHVILESAERLNASVERGAGRYLLPLSARTVSGLRSLAERIAGYLADHPHHVDQVCYTLATGRTHFPHRFATVADTASGLREQLQAWLREEAHGGSPPKTAKVALWLGAHTPAPVEGAAWPAVYQRAWSDAQAQLTAHGLHAITGSSFCHAWALGQLLAHWGFKPGCVAGEGACEAAALALAGGASLAHAAARAAGQVPTGTLTGTRLRCAWVRAADGRVFAREVATDDLRDVGKSICRSKVLDAFVDHRCTGVVATDGSFTSAPSGASPLPYQPDQLFDLLAELYRAGAGLNWQAIHEGSATLPIPLPTYPFARDRHWVTAVNHPEENTRRRASLGSALSDIRA